MAFAGTILTLWIAGLALHAASPSDEVKDLEARYRAELRQAKRPEQKERLALQLLNDIEDPDQSIEGLHWLAKKVFDLTRRSASYSLGVRAMRICIDRDPVEFVAHSRKLLELINDAKIDEDWKERETVTWLLKLSLHAEAMGNQEQAEEWANKARDLAKRDPVPRSVEAELTASAPPAPPYGITPLVSSKLVRALRIDGDAYFESVGIHDFTRSVSLSPNEKWAFYNTEARKEEGFRGDFVDLLKGKDHRVHAPTSFLDSVFLPDSSRLFAVHKGGNATLWDVERGALLNEFDLSDRIGFAGRASLTMLGDGVRCLIGADNRVLVVNPTSGLVLDSFEGFGSVNKVGVCPDYRHAWVADYQAGQIKVVDLHLGEVGVVWSFPERKLQKCGVGPDLRRCVIAVEGRLELWEWTSDGPAMQCELKAPRRINRITVGPHGETAATTHGSDSGDVVAVWDLRTGNRIRTIHELRRKTATRIEFNSSEELLLVGTENGIRIWKVR